MTTQQTPQKRKSKGRGFLVVGVLVLAIAAILGILSLVRSISLNSGLRAYQQADCEKALRRFRNLPSEGKKRETIAEEEAACEQYLLAVGRYEDGDYSAAFAAFMDFGVGFEDTPLDESAHSYVNNIMEQNTPDELASAAACDAFAPAYIPDADTTIPLLYYACSEATMAAEEGTIALGVQRAFLNEYPEHELADDIAASMLENPAACEEAASLQEDDAIANRDGLMPTLYLECGQRYDASEEQELSYAMYESLLTHYPDDRRATVAASALAKNPIACENVDHLQDIGVIAERLNFMPKLYYNCGQMHDAAENHDDAYGMYLDLLNKYPDCWHAGAAAAALLENPVACQNVDVLERNEVFERLVGFRFQLLYTCGVQAEEDGDYETAIGLYETLLDKYELHPQVEEIEERLAQALFDQAQAAGAGEIAPPASSGYVSGSLAVVVIQNDSPESLRIIFTGPETRIETLPACSTCENYFGVGPLYCPEKGPIGTYELEPGTYSILVEASSDSGTTPFTGTWTLEGGKEYYNCFFIVTTVGS